LTEWEEDGFVFHSFQIKDVAYEDDDVECESNYF